jgi:site-specific DNA recombinase
MERSLTPTPCVIYAAFSTAKGDTIEQQIEDCEEMAASEGWEVVGRFSDKGKSAFKGDRGPGLAQAMRAAEEAAKAGAPAVLLVRDPERLARGDSVGPEGARSFAEVALWASRSYVQLRAVRDDALISHPMLAGIVSELVNAESRRKSQRAASGAESRREQGLHPGGAVYGYAPDKELGLVPDPEQSPVVVRVFEELATGISQAEVARRLNAELKATGKPKPLRGKDWSQGSLSALVKRETYLGRIPADKPSDRSKKGRVEEWKPGKHEPLISEELFEAAHARIAERRKSVGNAGGRRPTAGHLLAGTMLRHSCGHSMTPRSNDPKKDGSVTGRYVCAGAKSGLCEGLTVDMEVVDDAISRYLAEVGIDAEASVRKASEAVKLASAQRDAEIQHKRNEAAEAKRTLERIRADYLAAKLSVDDYNSMKAETEQRQSAAEARLAELADSKPPTAKALVSTTLDTLALVRRAVESGQAQRVRELIGRLFEHFTIAEEFEGQVDPADEPEAKTVDLAEARARLRGTISKAEVTSGRKVEEANAAAIEEEALHPSHDYQHPDEGVIRTGGLVLIPEPRRDALAAILDGSDPVYLVDKNGRSIFKTLPLEAGTTYGASLQT